ncbi:hypothetical protein ACO1O0_007785 [Amphichorda felina]
MLRRAKNTVTLPHREDRRRFLKLSVQEQHAYDVAKQNAIEYLEDVLASSKPQEGYSNALQKINALRLICEQGCSPSINAENAPLLASGTPDASSTPNTTMGDAEGDRCGLETEEGSSSDISPHLQEYSIPGPSPCSWSPEAKPPHPVGQRPTKIQALVEDLQGCASGTKSVVFSYRTAVLNLANAALSNTGISCVQIDGKSNPKMRSQAISVFSKNETTQVLLLSLGCGAVG